MRLSKILEMQFENELVVMPNNKYSQSKSKKGEVGADEDNYQNSREDHDNRRSSSQDEYHDNRSIDGPHGRSGSSKSRKKKDKKDKKKEKKDKKKKNKDKDYKKDHDNSKSNQNNKQK